SHQARARLERAATPRVAARTLPRVARAVRPSGTRFDPPARSVQGWAMATTPASDAAVSERDSRTVAAAMSAGAMISGSRDIQTETSRLWWPSHGAVRSTG